MADVLDADELMAARDSNRVVQVPVVAAKGHDGLVVDEDVVGADWRGYRPPRLRSAGEHAPAH